MYRESDEGLLSKLIQDPNFEAVLLRNTYSEAAPAITENDIDFLDKVEAINYLTENIIGNYYENALVDDDEYFVDEAGELVANYPEERVDRIESYIDSI